MLKATRNMPADILRFEAIGKANAFPIRELGAARAWTAVGPGSAGSS